MTDRPSIRRATSPLLEEHDLILRALAAFERVLDEAAREERLHREHATQALEFFRTFADANHHGKEELVLASKLAEMGVPDRAGELAAMRADIERENEVLFPMSEATLDDSATEEVFNGYDVAETELEPGTQERMAAIADELCRAYRVGAEEVAAFQAAGRE